MLTVTVKNYCETTDSFNVDILDSLNSVTLNERLPATLLPYIASDLCNECEDLPFDLIGKTFTMKCSYIDN